MLKFVILHVYKQPSHLRSQIRLLFLKSNQEVGSTYSDWFDADTPKIALWLVRLQLVFYACGNLFGSKPLRHKEHKTEDFSRRGCLVHLKTPGFPINLEIRSVLPWVSCLSLEDELLLNFDAIADILVVDRFICYTVLYRCRLYTK